MNDLKHDLQSIADRHANQAGGDFDTVLRTATTRGRRRVAGISAAACAVLAVGAIATLSPWQNDAAPAPAPVASKPTLDPKYQGTMTITPATAAPGAQIGLTFPEGYLRGLGFTLAEPDGGKVLYFLSSAHGESKARWAAADGTVAGLGLPSLGRVGKGPDHVVVPDTAAEGTYLLCTDRNTKSGTACALLTVAR